MKKLILASATLFVFAASAAAQTPTPAPPRSDNDVVKISTALIQLDVSVTDRKGNPVRDLKPEDFEIFENGEKQTISGFRFVSSERKVNEVTAKPSADKLGIPIPPAELKPEQVRRTIALVVDDLSLSFESAYQTRRALRKFVDEQVQEGDLVAIIRVGAGIGALQQFTSDKRQLYAAVERVKWNPRGVGNIGAFAPIEPTMSELAAAMGDTTVSAEDIKQEKDSINAQNDFRSSIFATGTLGALRFVVGGMAELPGRKSVVLFSDGFRLMDRDEMGGTGGGRVMEFLRQLIDLANRSSVVFYTIDARGLQTTSITAQDKITNITSPTAYSEALSSRRDELLETQAGLQFLAEETGGFAVINNNDLAGGVRKVLEDQSYYLISYEPDTDTFDAAKRKFNKLDVRVRRDGTKVRYRSGFFNVSDEKINRPLEAGKAPQNQLTTALASPFVVNDIALRLNLLYANDARRGNYIKALLHIDVKDLKFTPAPKGEKQATFEVLSASFGDNGMPVEQVGRSYTVTVNEANYERMLVEGLVYHLTLPVEKPGAYQYRVAVRDAQANKVGSASQFIEVPNLKKRNHQLSGIVLDSFSTEVWQKAVSSDSGDLPSNSLGDSSLRRFKQDSVLRYGFEIYNAKLDASKKPNLTTRIRVILDGKLVLDGKPLPLELTGQTDMARLKSVGVVSFGKGTPPGEYILQVIVIDKLAKPKQQISTQYIQFEITD